MFNFIKKGFSPKEGLSQPFWKRFLPAPVVNLCVLISNINLTDFQRLFYKWSSASRIVLLCSLVFHVSLLPFQIFWASCAAALLMAVFIILLDCKEDKEINQKIKTLEQCIDSYTREEDRKLHPWNSVRIPLEDTDNFMRYFIYVIDLTVIFAAFLNIFSMCVELPVMLPFSLHWLITHSVLLFIMLAILFFFNFILKKEYRDQVFVQRKSCRKQMERFILRVQAYLEDCPDLKGELESKEPYFLEIKHHKESKKMRYFSRKEDKERQACISPIEWGIALLMGVLIGALSSLVFNIYIAIFVGIGVTFFFVFLYELNVWYENYVTRPEPSRLSEHSDGDVNSKIVYHFLRIKYAYLYRPIPEGKVFFGKSVFVWEWLSTTFPIPFIFYEICHMSGLITMLGSVVSYPGLWVIAVSSLFAFPIVLIYAMKKMKDQYFNMHFDAMYSSAEHCFESLKCVDQLRQPMENIATGVVVPFDNDYNVTTHPSAAEQGHCQ